MSLLQVASWHGGERVALGTGHSLHRYHLVAAQVARLVWGTDVSSHFHINVWTGDALKLLVEVAF